MNLAILAGRLGKDPEVSYTQGGTAKCKFSLATSRKYKDRQTGEMKEDTQWHNIVVWGKQAESCGKYLAKGSYVVIRGEIQNRSWDDQQSGQKKYITEIKADSVEFGPSGGQGGRRGSQGGGQSGGVDQGDGQGGQGGQSGRRGSQGGFFGGDDDPGDIPF